MKYVVSLLLGAAVGVLLVALAIIYNPLTSDPGLSPLSVTDAEVMALTYSSVPAESIVYTNDGESRHAPHPVKTLQLWEAPIRLTTAMATVMNDARNQPAGLGVKFLSRSERSNLLYGEALADSVWYIYLPGRGTLFIQQSENFWPFIKNVMVPAWRSSASMWKGNWLGDMTAGPGALRTGLVTGSSGEFDGLQTEALESLSVQAYSLNRGFVSASGRLVIEMPQAAVTDGDE